MWLKILTELRFKQRIDMGNQKENFIGCKASSRYSDILLCKIHDLQDPTITCPIRIQDPQDPAKKNSVRDPRLLGSHGNVTVKESKISKIHEKMKIQDPGSSKVSDPGSPRSRIQDLL